MVVSIINILVATKVEAKPIIDFFRLTEFSVQQKKTIYTNGRVSLCVAGVGVENMRKATSVLKAMTRDKAIWVNFGIAGGGDDMSEQLVLAKRVYDADKELYWSSFVPENMPFRVVDVATVVKPKQHYQNAIVYDMEAAGFIAVIDEHIAVVVKLITDTPQTPWCLQTKADIQKKLDEKKTNIYHFFELLCQHKQ